MSFQILIFFFYICSLHDTLVAHMNFPDKKYLVLVCLSISLSICHKPFTFFISSSEQLHTQSPSLTRMFLQGSFRSVVAFREMFNPCWLTCFDFNFIELKTSSTGMNVIRVNNLFLRMHTIVYIFLVIIVAYGLLFLFCS